MSYICELYDRNSISNFSKKKKKTHTGRQNFYLTGFVNPLNCNMWRNYWFVLEDEAGNDVTVNSKPKFLAVCYFSKTTEILRSNPLDFSLRDYLKKKQVIAETELMGTRYENLHLKKRTRRGHLVHLSFFFSLFLFILLFNHKVRVRPFYLKQKINDISGKYQAGPDPPFPSIKSRITR